MRSITSILIFVANSLNAAHADHYKTFDAMARGETGAFSITHVPGRNPAVTVMAIHGGLIEPHTSEIAKAIAGAEYGLYLFEGRRSADNFKFLHITSSRFTEPLALKIAGQSKSCISVHGFRDAEARRVCLGGNNPKLRAAIKKQLMRPELRLQVEDFCPGKEGTEPGNIVNRCQDQGVQLELSSRLRDELSRGPEDFRGFIEAIRGALPPPAGNSAGSN